MNKTRQAVETVNFRLCFKVIIRQNETQYFTYSIIQSKRARAQRHRKRVFKTVELYLHDGNTLHSITKRCLSVSQKEHATQVQ